MFRIFRGLTVALSGALLFGLMPAAAHATTVSLPHTHHFDTVSPWTQVYSGSALDSSTSAPGSASTSLRFRYGSGMTNGTAPDKVWLNFTPAQTEIWTQYWFKYSDNFYFHSVDNKQMYWYIASSTLSTNFYTSCVGGKINFIYQRTPGSGRRTPNESTTTINRDTWYKLTVRAVLNTNGASNGIIQVWVNDVLNINYSNVPYLTGDDVGKKIGSLAFDPVFGGGSPTMTKPATDYFYVDYVRIQTSSFGSSSDSSSGGDSSDSSAVPLAPSNISIQ